MKVREAGMFDSLLSKFGRFAPLDSHDRGVVQAWPWTERRVERGRSIGGDRGGVPACMLLVAGLMARHRTSVEGKQQILSFHFPGDFVDLSPYFGREDQVEVVAIQAARLACVPVEAMRDAAADRPNIARALTTDMLVDAAIGREWLLSVGQRNAAGRLAHLLCEAAIRLSATGFGEPTSFDFPFTQGDLASAVGLTSVHVNRTLRILKDQGLISYGAQHVTIRDLARLRRLGDFNPSYLHELATA